LSKLLYRACYKIMRFLILKIHVVGRQNLETNGPVILVSNHAGSFGPLSIVSSFPLILYPWITHEIVDEATVAKKIQLEFLEGELHWKPPFSTTFAKWFGRVCIALMKNINAIPVYDKSRKIKVTLEKSIEMLRQGKKVLIFGESAKPSENEDFHELATGFIGLAKGYFDATSESVSILPMAVNSRASGVSIGTPIAFDPTVPYSEEKIKLKKSVEAEIRKLYYSMEK
jgi:1-acyl-sn-glycerol-3-phosphate acyltransferase